MERIEVTDEQIDLIRQMFEDGKTKKAVCEALTISRDVLFRLQLENEIYSSEKDKQRFLIDDATQLKLFDLFENSELPLWKIKNKLKVDTLVMNKCLKQRYGETAVKERKRHLYSKSKLGDKNPQTYLRREKSPKWKGGKPDTGDGYTFVFNDGWIETKDFNDYVYEHQLVMLKALNLHAMPKDFAIHHIDRNRKNNSIDNLALLHNSAHTRLHACLRNKKLYKHLKDFENQIEWNQLESLVGCRIPDVFTMFCIDGNVDNFCISNIALVTKTGLASLVHLQLQLTV